MKKNKKILLSVFMFMLSIFFLNIDTYAAHSHTPDCYKDAILHTCDGNEISGGACYTIPLYHRHSAECYSSACSNDYNKVISSYVNTEYCPICGKMEYKIEFKCDICQKVISDIGCSTETCSNYLDSRSMYDNFQHGEISKDLAMALGGKLICGKDESIVEKYSKTCGKENGSYYDLNGNKSNPICNTIAKSWILENEKQSGETFNSNVIVTFLDGHTETVIGKHTFDTIDKTKSSFDEPVMVYVDLLTSAIGTKQTQTLIAYYTRNIENTESIDSIIGEETKEVEPIENKDSDVIQKNTKEELDGTSTDMISEDIINEDIITTEDLDNIEKETNDIMLISENPIKENESYTLNIVPITILLVCVIALVFIGINLFIMKKKK